MIDNSQMCGGTNRSVDNNAPKEIKSEDMTLFNVESALGQCFAVTEPAERAWFSFISVFAAKTETGVFAVLNARDYYDKREFRWAYVSADVFPELVRVTREQNLAQSNGVHEFTNGLPENFGGAVRIKYSSGEQIDFSSNREPLITPEFALWLYNFFDELMKSDSVGLPDVEDIRVIRFDSVHDDGGYNHTVLTDNGDGTCRYERERKFSYPDVYNDDMTISDEMFKKFRTIIKNNAMLVWHMMPESNFKTFEEKSMTFVCKDGTEVFVPSDRILPAQVSGAFFSIELDLNYPK